MGLEWNTAERWQHESQRQQEAQQQARAAAQQRTAQAAELGYWRATLAAIGPAIEGAREDAARLATARDRAWTRYVLAYHRLQGGSTPRQGSGDPVVLVPMEGMHPEALAKWPGRGEYEAFQRAERDAQEAHIRVGQLEADRRALEHNVILSEQAEAGLRAGSLPTAVGKNGGATVRRQRFSQEQVIGAIRRMRGLATLAARELDCDPKTVHNYCVRYPRVRAALGAARAQQLDVAEAELFKAVDRGEPWAIQFLLRTIGRARGYGDKLEIDAQVDLTTSPEWVRTRTVLLGALRAYPEAQLAVVGALQALRAPRDEDTG